MGSSGNHRQIWYQVWCLFEKDCQEDGNFSAQQVHLHLLWQGLYEASLCRHLAVQGQELQNEGRRRRLELFHHRWCICQICCQEVEGDQREVNWTYIIYLSSLFPFVIRVCIYLDITYSYVNAY